MEFALVPFNISTIEGNSCQEQEEISVKFNLFSLNGENDPFSVYRKDIWNSLVAMGRDKPPIHFQSPQVLKMFMEALYLHKSWTLVGGASCISPAAALSPSPARTPPHFLLDHTHLEFRGTLVRKLRRLCQKLDYTMGTLQSAVDLLDRFMDSYSMEPRHLVYVALACLSVAAKNHEERKKVVTVQFLMNAARVKMSVAEFCRIEMKVGQNVSWRLQAPNPASFTALLEPVLVTPADLAAGWPDLARHCARALHDYLDLTLSDVRLKAIQTVELACACVACARRERGLPAWPDCFARDTGVKYSDIARVVARLHKMKYMMMEAKGFTMPMQASSVSLTPSPSPPTSPIVCTNAEIDAQNGGGLDCSTIGSTPNSRKKVSCSVAEEKQEVMYGTFVWNS